MVHFDCPVHSLQGTVLPQKQWYRWKAETLKVCLLLVWRVSDQAFGRCTYEGCWKVVTWSSRNWKFAKIHWFQKCYSFRSTTKNKVIVEKPFQNSGVTRHLWHFQHDTVLERSTEVRFSLILSFYEVVYISIKDLHAGRNLLSYLPKMRIWIGWNRTSDVQPIIIL